MAREPKKPAKASGEPASAPTRLALDRFLVGVWSERDLLSFLAAKGPGAGPLKPLAEASALERPRAAERLREELFGAARPGEVERYEALLRQGVDLVAQGMPVLSELQHDLQAHVDAVGAADPRGLATRALADYAVASQVHLAVQEVGRLAEATTDRVARARAEALEKLTRLLAPFPHLLPRD